MRVRWGHRASKQLAEAYEFALSDSPPAADRQLIAILDAVERLADFPMLGRVGQINGTRELVINLAPYIAAYRVHRSPVSVLALLHGARRWHTHF